MRNRGALSVAQPGQVPHHVGDVVLALGVVVAEHRHARVEDLRVHQVEARIDAGAELVELLAGVTLSGDAEIVPVGLEKLLEFPPVDGPFLARQGQDLAGRGLLLGGIGDVRGDDRQKVFAAGPLAVGQRRR